MTKNDDDRRVERIYQYSANGIAEAVRWPDAGDEVTLRGFDEKATVERVDRRRHLPVILEDGPIPAVAKRGIVEFSKRTTDE